MGSPGFASTRRLRGGQDLTVSCRVMVDLRAEIVVMVEFEVHPSVRALVVSSGREPPPPALLEPYVTVSRHTAPTVRRSSASVDLSAPPPKG